MKGRMLKLVKSGRVCYPFPWVSTKEPQPWPSAYSRVMITYTPAEMRTRNDSRRCHVQIVRRDSLEVIREVRFG